MVRVDLICINKHSFEGTFSSKDGLLSQLHHRQMFCPICYCDQIMEKISSEIMSFVVKDEKDYIAMGKRPVVIINEQLFDHESMPGNELSSLALEQLIIMITQELSLEDAQQSIEVTKINSGRQLSSDETSDDILILKLLQSGQMIH